MDEIYGRLSTKLGYPGSKHLPAIFEAGASLRQAQILEQLNQAPAPALTAEQLAETVGLDANVIQEDLEDLFRKGLAFPRNFQDRREWRYGKGPMQLHDAMIAGSRFFADKQKLFDLWHEYHLGEGYKDYAAGYEMAGGAVMRVIPVWQSVADDPDLRPWEDWREILREKALMSVVDCPCRLEVGACDRPVPVCIDFDRTAEYDIASQHGSKIDYDEALKIMDEAGRAGLVPTAANTAAVGIMCNCCSDCCVVFQTAEKCDLPVGKGFAKSRYEAQVDQEACDGCQDCVDMCNFDAIDMVKSEGSKKLKAQVDAEPCFGCGCCFTACDNKAISLKCVRPVSHVPGAA
jgi:NAD-dependent dihydropyrimidine dehydrogenase PreA subunit